MATMQLAAISICMLMSSVHAAKPWIVDMATERAMHARNMNLTELKELNPDKARAVQKLIYEDQLRSLQHLAVLEKIQKNRSPQAKPVSENVSPQAKPVSENVVAAPPTKEVVPEEKAAPTTHGAKISTVPFESITANNHAASHAAVSQDTSSVATAKNSPATAPPLDESQLKQSTPPAETDTQPAAAKNAPQTENTTSVSPPSLVATPPNSTSDSEGDSGKKSEQAQEGNNTKAELSNAEVQKSNESNAVSSESASQESNSTSNKKHGDTISSLLRVTNQGQRKMPEEIDMNNLPADTDFNQLFRATHGDAKAQKNLDPQILAKEQQKQLFTSAFNPFVISKVLNAAGKSEQKSEHK